MCKSCKETFYCSRHPIVSWTQITAENSTTSILLHFEGKSVIKQKLLIFFFTISVFFTNLWMPKNFDIGFFDSYFIQRLELSEMDIRHKSLLNTPCVGKLRFKACFNLSKGFCVDQTAGHLCDLDGIYYFFMTVSVVKVIWILILLFLNKTLGH